MSQSKESVSEESKKNSSDHAMMDNANDQWSERSIFSMQSNSLISDDNDSSADKIQKRGVPNEQGYYLDQVLLERFEQAVRRSEDLPEDPQDLMMNKVAVFIEANPLNHVFIKREKARLPYSVFKPHA